MGEVTLISDAHPFRNRQIGEKDHAEFLWALIEDSGNRSVLIVIGGDISFFGLLWSRGWMVLVPVLLALVVWLWKSFPRHGPLLADEEASERDFARHVDVLGQFLWRHDATGELLAPVRRRIQHRLQGSLATGDSDEEREQWESLHERSGVPVDRLRAAMTLNPGRDPARFVQISRDLRTLENSL